VAIPSQTVSEEPPPQPDSVDGAAREPDLAAQVDQLKSELDSAQQRQAAQAEDQERRVAARTEALSALQRAGMDLALGDSEVDGELSEAEPALTPFARAAVSAARRSLENDDLFAARQYLQQAIAAETPAGPSGVEASNATPTVGDEAH
jgi:hypothetical protein